MVIYFRKSMPWGWTIANILLKKIHAALGLDRCGRIGTGAAPITKEIIDYFASLNMPLLEVYGMSECSGRNLPMGPNLTQTVTIATDKRGYPHNSFLISRRKHMLWVFIRSASARCF